MAAQAADILTRLVLTRNLERFACEMNLSAGSMRSAYATPEEVARVTGKPVGFLLGEKARAA